MITPAFGLTATERVLPRLALDWTTGLPQAGVDVTRAGVATFVGSNGLIQSATADTQRIDYSTGVAGLLVEESRVNLLLYSEELDISPTWTRDNCSVTGDIVGVDTPNGTQTASKLIPNSGALANSRIRQNITYTAQRYTNTTFVKQADSNFLYFVTASSAVFNPAPSVYVDLSNGQVLQSTNATTVVQPFSNGWYRVSVTPTANATASTSFFGMLPGVADAVGSAAVTGDGVKGVYLWGSQLEPGVFSTSYIPTEATTVTRNADVATMTGTNFSDWFNASEGAFMAKGGPVARSGALFSVSDNTFNNYMSHIFRFGTSSRTWIFDNNVEVANIITNASGDVAQHVFGYKIDNVAQAVNGGAAVSDTSVPIPTVNRLTVGARVNGNYLNGHIQKLLYWPHRLTNAEIQAFSKQG